MGFHGHVACHLTKVSGVQQFDFHKTINTYLAPTFYISICILSWPGSSFGIATELQAGRSVDRIPVGRDFPPVQTGPGTYPSSCTVGTGSFPGVKYSRGVLLTTNPLLVPWSWKSRAIPLPTLWATTRPITGTLYVYLYSCAFCNPAIVTV